MPEIFQRISQPEIFLGIVAPIGTDLSTTIEALKEAFIRHNYRVCEIRITDIFDKLKKAMPNLPNLITSDSFNRYKTFIDFGNKLREVFNDDAFMASLAISKVTEARHSPMTGMSSETCERVVYIIRQFKRKEETDLLRQVYGALFFQISIFMSRNARVESLAKTIASSRNQGVSHPSRSDAERLIEIDEDEADNEHGQKVSDVFHDADAIVNKGIRLSERDQVNRIVDLMFGANDISPTKIEYGLYVAKSASFKSLDLSRQVGAAIFTSDGQLLSLGTNEVPQAGGGTYWSDDENDARDYKKKEDINQKRKREILCELIDLINPECDKTQVMASAKIRNSQFMDALEYSRVVHAEMNAICDAARIGHSIRDATLFCTTFPCHMCAKHIVSSGISKVIYLEPYPKSLAMELNDDALAIEGSVRGEYKDYRFVEFCHFHGVSPRRYREFFERKKRKDSNGGFQRWRDGIARPIVDIFIPNYLSNESAQIGLIDAAFEKQDVNAAAIFQFPTNERSEADSYPA